MHFAISFEGGIDDLLRRFHARDVVAGGDGFSTGSDDFITHGFGGFDADVIDDDIRAFGGVGEGIRLAQAAARAGDDDGALIADTHG